MQYGVSLTLTRQRTASLQESKFAMRLGNWISMRQQLTMGLSQAPPPPPPPSSYPKSSKMSTQRDWRFRTAMFSAGSLCLRTTKQPVTSTQQSPLSRSSRIRCFTLLPRRDRVRNQFRKGSRYVVHPQQQTSRTVSFNVEVIKRTNSLRYLGIHCDKMLTYKTQVESTKLRCKKGLSVLKSMASKGIKQCHLFLLYQSVILSVIDNGLGLTTLSQPNLLKLDRVHATRNHEIHSENNKTCATYWTCHPWNQDITWAKSKRTPMRCKIPRIHSPMLSKKKRG